LFKENLYGYQHVKVASLSMRREKYCNASHKFA